MKKITVPIVIAIIMSGCSGNKDSKTEQEVMPPSSIPAASIPVPKVQKAPDDIVLSKKDTGKTDKIIFLVKNISEPIIDKNTPSYAKPEEGNEKFICAQIWVKNTSNTIDTIQQDDFKLFDQKDAEFVELPSALNHKEPDLFNPTYLILKPNQSKSGWITFTTDKESKAKKIAYSNIIIKL
jgi:hypothetical protein